MLPTSLPSDPAPQGCFARLRRWLRQSLTRSASAGPYYPTMELLAWPIFAFLLLAVAGAVALWSWSYGGTRPRGDVARSSTWLGCSVLGTLAALVFSIFLAEVGTNHTQDGLFGVVFEGTGRVSAIWFSPLLIALLVVAITARGRAGPMPGRRRLLKLLFITGFVLALIAASYLILNIQPPPRQTPL